MILIYIYIKKNDVNSKDLKYFYFGDFDIGLHIYLL